MQLGDGVTLWSDAFDMIKYTLDRSMAYESGTGLHYCSGNANVLGEKIVIVMTGGNHDDDLMFQNRPISRDCILPAILTTKQ